MLVGTWSFQTWKLVDFCCFFLYFSESTLQELRRPIIELYWWFEKKDSDMAFLMLCFSRHKSLSFFSAAH